MNEIWIIIPIFVEHKITNKNPKKKEILLCKGKEFRN